MTILLITSTCNNNWVNNWGIGMNNWATNSVFTGSNLSPIYGWSLIWRIGMHSWATNPLFTGSNFSAIHFWSLI